MKCNLVLALVGAAAVCGLSAEKAAAQGVYQVPGSSTQTNPPPVVYPAPVYYPTPVYYPAPVVYGGTYNRTAYYGNRYYGNRYYGNRYYGARYGYGYRGGYRVGFRR